MCPCSPGTLLRPAACVKILAASADPVVKGIFPVVLGGCPRIGIVARKVEDEPKYSRI